MAKSGGCTVMSLFICPKCGFQDEPVWKSSKWRLYSVYCHTTELEAFNASLVQKLKDSKDGWVFDNPYWYKINRKGNIIYRMLKIGKDEFQTHGFTEKHRPKDPSQTKLLEAAR